MWHTARQDIPRNFGEEHEEEILLHQAAKNAFDEMGLEAAQGQRVADRMRNCWKKRKRPMPSTGVPVKKCGAFDGKPANVDRVLKMEVEQDVENKYDGQR